MSDERIAKMTDNVVAEMTDEEFSPTVPHVRIAAVSSDEDVALANVDQALDVMLASVAVIDDNLLNIKTASVPEKAAVDAVKDLMDSAVKPYLADILKAMQVFGK